MADFALSDEQEALRDFAQKETAPLTAKRDQEEKHSQEIARKAYPLALMNIAIPEEYGGPGLEVFEDRLVAEELAAATAA